MTSHLRKEISASSTVTFYPEFKSDLEAELLKITTLLNAEESTSEIEI